MKQISVSILLCALMAGCSAAPSPPPQNPSTAVAPREGDRSKHGGSPTVRKEYEPEADDPDTTNDESNDQPTGHFGSMTLVVTGPAGHEYTLDADVDDRTLQRLYFPKGGWLDFDDCELDEDMSGECEDEKGQTWTIQGEG